MDELRCSFCGKDKDEVAKLIAGPGVYICNECVDLCVELIAEDATSDSPSAPPPAVAPPPGDPLGPYLREIARYPELDAEEQRLLAKRIADGDLDAKQQLIQSSLRLVVPIARRYVSDGAPLLDLIQEGNVGLMRAVDKLEWREGFSFPIYAAWWIRQAIQRALGARPKIAHVPAEDMERILSTFLEGERAILRARFGLDDEPPITLDDAARRFGLTRERVRILEAKLEDEIRAHRSPAPTAAGPKCPSCTAPLDGARQRILEVPSAEPGAPSARVLFLYCGACGLTIDDVILPGEA